MNKYKIHIKGCCRHSHDITNTDFKRATCRTCVRNYPAVLKKFKSLEEWYLHNEIIIRCNKRQMIDLRHFQNYRYVFKLIDSDIIQGYKFLQDELISSIFYPVRQGV